MTTINITLTSTCAGGGHLTFGITGAKTMTAMLNLDQLTEPISDEDAVIFCKIIARMARAGRTLGAARALLQSGVVVNV